MTQAIAQIGLAGTAIAAVYVALKILIFLLRTLEALAKPALAGAMTCGLAYAAYLGCTLQPSGWELLVVGSLLLATVGASGFTAKYMRQAIKSIDDAWQDLWEL